MEMTVAAEKLLNRIPAFSLAGPVKWSEGTVHRPRQLPIKSRRHPENGGVAGLRTCGESARRGIRQAPVDSTPTVVDTCPETLGRYHSTRGPGNVR